MFITLSGIKRIGDCKHLVDAVRSSGAVYDTGVFSMQSEES